MVKNKIILVMALMMAVVFSAISFTPSVALAKSFSINNRSQHVSFNVSGKGGFFKEKNFSFTIKNNGPDAIRIIYGWDQGVRINPGHSYVVSFSVKGGFNFKQVIADEGNFGRTQFDVESGNLAVN